MSAAPSTLAGEFAGRYSVDRLKRDKQLPIEDVIAIGKTILSALEFAHERNLLHRGVKPENILFTNGEACLSDSGIARAMEAPRRHLVCGIHRWCGQSARPRHRGLPAHFRKYRGHRSVGLEGY